MRHLFDGLCRVRASRSARLWLGVMVAMQTCATALAAPDRLFPADAVVNVTLPPYSAKPDDGNDDTAAIQKAIRDNVDTGRVLYFPTGTYDISDTLVARDAKGLWRPRLTLQGQNRDKTSLRLRRAAPGFGDPAHPKAMIMTGSFWQDGDGLDGGGNKAFGNYILDLTIDAGAENAGAVGVEYAVSNFGTIGNVTIRSDDGAGVAGIAMLRKIPGPGLISDVSVTGFGVALDLGDVQYGVTVENLRLKGQRIAGIRVSQNLLHARSIESDNRVPAIMVTHPGGVVTLLNSNLLGGAADQPAIDCAGTLLVRELTTQGYRPAAIRCRGRDIPGQQHSEWSSSAPPPAAGQRPATTSALLPVESAPDYYSSNLADWVAVGARHPGENDDTAAIQRAIDSGKRTVYLPNNRVYFISDTVVVRGEVAQILGMGAEISLGAAKEPFSDRKHPRPLLRIDPTRAPGVCVENVFFNAQYPGEVIFENNSPKPLVIRHCAGWVGAEGYRRSYQNTPAATGPVFVEDVFLPGWDFSRQSVWARQCNPENPDGDGKTPQVANHGGRLWILGFKTEGPAPFLTTDAGGVSELLGAYNYVSATQLPQVPADAVPYLVTDAVASLTFATDNFRDSDYRVYVRQSIGGQVRNWGLSQLPPRSGNQGDRSLAVPLLQAGSKPQ